MDCSKSQMLRVIGHCIDNANNIHSAGVFKTNIVPSVGKTGALDEWGFVNCCLAFMAIILVASLVLFFNFRGNESYPMTEYSGHQAKDFSNVSSSNSININVAETRKLI